LIRRVVAVALVAASCTFASAGESQVEAVGAPTPVDTWAWCGVHPDDPVAAKAARSMAEFSGIDATFGPCKDASPGYSPAFPGDRYVEPDEYMRLVLINAAAGMQTVVYDDRVWDLDPQVRKEAKAFWKPVYEHIAAWDMGDEFGLVGENFDRDDPEWQLLAERTQLVLDDVAAETYIQPFSNHLAAAVEAALEDIPGNRELLSFDQYWTDKGVAIAESLDDRVETLMCAVNTYTHPGYSPSAATIRDDTGRLIDAGCDMILVFGGAQVYDSAYFPPLPSIIDASGEPTDRGTATLEATGYSSYVGVAPARLLETRVGPGLATIDGQSNGIGARANGTTTEVKIAGRAGVRTGASSAVVSLTASGAGSPGFVTIYPCGTTRPNVAQLTYGAGQSVATTAMLKLSTTGTICLFNSSLTDLVIDVSGYFPRSATTFVAVEPARLLETRSGPGLTTVDGALAGVGVRGAGSITQLTVTGRAGVPYGATSASLSVTVANPRQGGFVTVYPCLQQRPPTASVNFTAGATVTTNAVVSGIANNGWICIFTSTDIDLIVDVNGYSPSGASLSPLSPQRLLDTRTRPRPAPPSSSVFVPIRELRVAGVAGVPTNAKAVAINVTATGSTVPGFVTVFPCGSPQPNASNLNFGANQTVSNLVIAEVGLRGSICLFSSADPDYVVDVTAFHP